MPRRIRPSTGTVAVIAIVSLAGRVLGQDGHEGHDHGHDHGHEDHDDHATPAVLPHPPQRIGAQAASESPEHAEPYEWAGMLATPDDWYLFTTQKVGDPPAYADVTMKMAVLAAADSSEATLEMLQREGHRALERPCKVATFGSVLVPKRDICYELQLDVQASLPPAAL